MTEFTLPSIDRTSRLPPEQRGDHEEIDRLHDLGKRDRAYSPTEADLVRVLESFERLQRMLAGGEVRIYGIHTGFGKSAGRERDPEGWRQVQLDLLRGLHVGVGEPLPRQVVRRALRLQCGKVARGLSAIHPETFERFVGLSNGEALPEVPRTGSLGASGDLIPMAHAVAPLFAEEPPRGPRDVIGLVNTNSVMSAWAVELFQRIEGLLNQAYSFVAAASLAMGIAEEIFSPAGLEGGGVHEGYLRAGSAVAPLRLRILETLDRPGESGGNTQPRYSVRCSPQILGSCEELLAFAARRLLSEATAIADNPVIAPGSNDSGPDSDLEGGFARHGGLFYAAGIANGADAMIDCAAKLAEMCDRQALNLVDPQLNGGLPDNLSHDSYGCKGVHILISSLCQEIRALSTPARLLSFSAENDNQDLVPCAMTVLNNLDRGLDALEHVLRSATLLAGRALHLRFGLEMPAALELPKVPGSPG